MNRVRVEIDLNSVRADGTTRVRLSRADGALNVGQIVTAYESEDGIAGLAMVDRVDPSTGYAFITVNRHSLRDDDGTIDVISAAQNSNRAVARVANQHAAQRDSSAVVVHQYALRRAVTL